MISSLPLVNAAQQGKKRKNDINARLAYRHLGYDLKTEQPKPAKITAAIRRVLADPAYKSSIARIAP